MALTKVTKSGITNDSIDAAKLENTSITSADIAPGTLTNAKLANSSVTVNGSTVSLGGSVDTTYISWQSVKTSSFTAVAGEGYFCDTTSSSITVTLPASPSAGDTVAIKDYAGTFATNNLIIGRNSENIQGVANNSSLSTNRASVILVYADATKGWLYSNESNVADLQQATFISATGGTETTSGNFKIHSFTGDGCFTVSSLGNCAGGGAEVSYLVVAGGGGGGGGPAANQGKVGGGGGAGGYREGKASNDTYSSSPLVAPAGITVTASTYPITIGGGGNGQESPGGQTNGSPSSFGPITSTGGGAGGGAASAQNAETIGNSGGSGGGGAREHPGGTGNTPPVSPSQGTPGSAGPNVSPDTGDGGGGGGGALQTGQPKTAGHNGGGGATISITGSCVAYAGGGGGSARISGYPGGTGGAGGGGNGSGPGTSNSAGTANRGGGGGAGGGNCSGSPAGSGIDSAGRAGGKGIVIIRYKYQ